MLKRWFVTTLMDAIARFKHHFEFFLKFDLLSRKELLVAVSLSTAVVCSEALGLAMVYPVLTFIETGGNIEAFITASKINAFVAHAMNFVGLKVSLAPLMLVSFLLINVRQIINSFSVTQHEYIKWSIGRRLGKKIIYIFFHSKADFASSIKSGELTALIDSESQAVASIMQTYLATWQITVSFFMYFSLIMFVSPVPATFLILFLALVSLLLRRFVRRTFHLGEQSVAARSNIFNFISERYSAWKTVKLMNSAATEVNKFNELSNILVSLRLDMARVSEKMALAFIPMAIGSLFIVLYLLVDFFDVKIGVLMMFGLVMLRLVPVAQSYQKKMTLLAKFEPSLLKIEAILLNSNQLREDSKKGVEYTPLKKCIEFKDVSFCYPNRKNTVLSDVSFKIPKGKLTGIIGASGSGKTTILDVICGLWEPDKGEVFFDNVSIKDINAVSLRSEIALLGQEPFLFDDTVRNNLSYARADVLEKDLITALKLSNLWDFVNTLPNGLDTKIGDKGSLLSVGQKQRLAISRALVSNASIILLDEPTSSLDQKSEAHIVEMLGMLVKQGKTVIVVAHRLQTLSLAHNVIHIEGGTVVNEGNPKKVIAGIKKVQVTNKSNR
ncbi:ABC transporter ATP-binding protein/permease [Alphaproteobacteria bacterium]|nr:ABC transporter ATP-binding protein/permease [Alphaproteobacteria bacterium]